MNAATTETAFDLETRIREKLKRQHFMHLIGADLTRIEPGRVVAELALGLQHQQQRGFAHGGLVATMADLVAGFASLTLVPEGVGVVTSDLKVSYPQPRRGPAHQGHWLGAESRPPPAFLRGRGVVRRRAHRQGLGHDGGAGAGMSVLNPLPGPGYTRVFENPAGGFVDVHENHGKQESRKNLPIALFLAARGERVCLLGIADEPNIKSPDATRNGVVWEFKIPEGRTENAIDKALRDGSRQASRILIQLPIDFNRDFLESGIYNRT